MRLLFISGHVHASVGWCMVGAVVVLSLAPPPDLPPVTDAYDDKIAHAFAYFAIMAWFACVTARASWRRLALAVITLGVALEFCQELLPYRTASFADALANTLGVALGALLAWLAGMNSAGPSSQGRAE